MVCITVFMQHVANNPDKVNGTAVITNIKNTLSQVERFFRFSFTCTGCCCLSPEPLGEGGPKYPKAAICLQKDREELMAFYDFPAQHWQSIRTSNPIESAFGTIRHRTKRSKGCLSRDGMLHMMFKLGLCAEKKWSRLRGFDYLAKVVTGIKFKDGVEVTEVDQVAA